MKGAYHRHLGRTRSVRPADRPRVLSRKFAASCRTWRRPPSPSRSACPVHLGAHSLVHVSGRARSRKPQLSAPRSADETLRAQFDRRPYSASFRADGRWPLVSLLGSDRATVRDCGRAISSRSVIRAEGRRAPSTSAHPLGLIIPPMRSSDQRAIRRLDGVRSWRRGACLIGAGRERHAAVVRSS